MITTISHVIAKGALQ